MNISQRSSHSKRLFGVTTFVIGAGVMAVELTASRLLAPFFGASMFVWTSLIVTILLALALGYWTGGNLAGKGAKIGTVGAALCGTSITLIFGVIILPICANATSGFLTSFSAAFVALFLGSFVAAVVAFAAPVFLLAAAGPILLKEWSEGSDIGNASGKYFAISTVGSVVGTLLPTLILVPTVGARHTIEMIALIFMALGLALIPWRRDALAALIFIPALAYSEIQPLFSAQKAIEQRESPYQLISVLSDGEKRYLTFNESLGVQSVYEPGAQRTGWYFDYLALLPWLRRSVDGSSPKIAFIGLAGGSGVRAFRTFLAPEEKTDITGVDLDPTVIEIGKKYFALGDLPMRIVSEDGRMFLQHTKNTFDVIVFDMYSTQVYIPPHVATKEFFTLAHARLSPGGMIAMNVNAPSDDSPLLKTLVNTIASQFKNVRVIPMPTEWNRVVMASDESIPLEEATTHLPPTWNDVALTITKTRDVRYDPSADIFTDDRAPIELLTDSMIVRAALTKEK